MIGLGALAAVSAIGFAVILAQPPANSVGQRTASPQPAPTDSSAPASASPPTETPSPTPSPSPTPTVTGFDVRWSAFDWPHNQGVNDVVHDDDTGQWIAAAGDSIFTASDARTWTRARVESAGCELPEEGCGWGIASVERLGDQLVAIGLKAATGTDSTSLVTWLSDDGTTWSLASDDQGTTAQDPDTAGSNDTVLIATPVLTGSMITLYNTSADGTTWESSREDGVQIRGVYGDADGFVGVGSFSEGGADSFDGVQPVVRISNDGHAWTTMTIGTANGDVLSAIARLPSGRYVAAGIGANGQVVVWASTGEDEPWTVTRLGEPHDLGGAITEQVVLADGPSGVILASNSGDGLIIATTIDGENWQATAGLGNDSSLLPTTIDMTADTAVAFAGPTNPANGNVAGLPFSGWIGAVTPTAD